MLSAVGIFSSVFFCFFFVALENLKSAVIITETKINNKGKCSHMYSGKQHTVIHPFLSVGKKKKKTFNKAYSKGGQYDYASSKLYTVNI